MTYANTLEHKEIAYILGCVYSNDLRYFAPDHRKGIQFCHSHFKVDDVYHKTTYQCLFLYRYDLHNVMLLGRNDLQDYIDIAYTKLYS